MLQNKDGKLFDIRENKVYPSGLYKVFQTRNKIAAPYKTTVTINGVVVDEISFDKSKSKVAAFTLVPVTTNKPNVKADNTPNIIALNFFIL